MSLSYTNYIFFLILWYIVPTVFIVPGRVRAERRRWRGDVAYDRRVAGLRSKQLAETSSGRVTSAGGVDVPRDAFRCPLRRIQYTTLSPWLSRMNVSHQLINVDAGLSHVASDIRRRRRQCSVHVGVPIVTATGIRKLSAWYSIQRQGTVSFWLRVSLLDVYSSTVLSVCLASVLARTHLCLCRTDRGLLAHCWRWWQLASRIAVHLNSSAGNSSCPLPRPLSCLHA